MKVCIQAGHKGMTTGSTGAPGERDWTTEFVPKVAQALLKYDVEVYETDAKGYNDATVVETDWDLFLSVHYDADIYNDRGGFCDWPDPSVDYSHEKSKELSEKIASHYFTVTGIPQKPQRSNANTKYYYMWQYLTAATPCVLIECGVGWRRPEDYETLRKDKTANDLADAIAKALGVYNPCMQELEECIKERDKLDQELDDMRDSRNRWRTQAEDCKGKYETDMANATSTIENQQKQISMLNEQATLLTRQYETCVKEKEVTSQTLKDLEETYKTYMEECERAKEACKKQLESKDKKIEKLTTALEECKKNAQEGLCGYSWWRRFRSLFGCRR